MSSVDGSNLFNNDGLKFKKPTILESTPFLYAHCFQSSKSGIISKWVNLFANALGILVATDLSVILLPAANTKQLSGSWCSPILLSRVIWYAAAWTDGAAADNSSKNKKLITSSDGSISNISGLNHTALVLSSFANGIPLKSVGAQSNNLKSVMLTVFPVASSTLLLISWTPWDLPTPGAPDK